jgi:hypothetical protein
MALYTFRDAIRSMVPWWAGRETGRIGKVLYAIGVHVDALVEAHVAAIKIAYPGLYSPESLSLIGRDRRIRRGPQESNEVYASRLPGWWAAHKRRGGPYALLEQLRAYWSNTFRIDLVYYSGRRFTALEDGSPIARDDIEWTPDSVPAKWARWWLFYFWPETVNDDGVWTDPGTWDDGGVWDSDLTLEDVANIRAIPAEWNAKHCYGRVVLLSDGAELWDYPEGPWDEPGGVWGGGAGPTVAQLDIAAT